MKVTGRVSEDTRKLRVKTRVHNVKLFSPETVLAKFRRWLHVVRDERGTLAFRENLDRHIIDYSEIDYLKSGTMQESTIGRTKEI